MKTKKLHIAIMFTEKCTNSHAELIKNELTRKKKRRVEKVTVLIHRPNTVSNFNSCYENINQETSNKVVLSKLKRKLPESILDEIQFHTYFSSSGIQPLAQKLTDLKIDLLLIDQQAAYFSASTFSTSLQELVNKADIPIILTTSQTHELPTTITVPFNLGSQDHVKLIRMSKLVFDLQANIYFLNINRQSPSDLKLSNIHQTHSTIFKNYFRQYFQEIKYIRGLRIQPNIIEHMRQNKNNLLSVTQKDINTLKSKLWLHPRYQMLKNAETAFLMV